MPATEKTPTRVVALTPANVPLSTTFARLVDGLRKAGVDVRPLAIPGRGPRPVDPGPPKLSELKAGLHALAEQVGAALRGSEPASSQEEADWLTALLQKVDGPIAGVVATDPKLARRVFPTAGIVWPAAVRVGVDGDFHVDPEWAGAGMDDLVTPHPALGSAEVRERGARLSAGGVLVGGEGVAPRSLDPERPQVVVSFARLEASDVDPLLFQLSLAKPETFSLLLLPSGRAGVDELVRARAGGYGLQGKRPRAGQDVEPWIRGAALLVGRPSPFEAACAVAAGVPQVLFAGNAKLDGGDDFLVKHGLAAHAPAAVMLSVEVESLMPGGRSRAAFETAVQTLELEGVSGTVTAVLAAIEAGRPSSSSPSSSQAAGQEAEELEDIGGGEPSARPTRMNDRVRRAYLKEIILQQQELERQLSRTRAGHDTWSRRLRLATQAHDAALARQASVRVEGLTRIQERLQARRAEVNELRERFAGGGALSATDRQAASRFMGAEAAAALDDIDRSVPSEAFDRLELDDQLSRLKRRMDSDRS